MKRPSLLLNFALLILSSGLVSASAVVAADWPMFRGNAARSGYTTDALPDQLQLQWTYRLPHAPQPAWPRSDRLAFDRAPQTIVVGNSAFLGDTVEGTVTALDLQTGQVRWQFTTEGPVRFAPAAWQDRLFAVSDDGWLYALAQADGRLLWKRRGGPEQSRRLGNERMISRWPARGGAVVQGDLVYFAAGIWPSDGIYLMALDAASGEPRWVNDDSGSIYMPQPHGGADAESGVAAQGYLVATDLPTDAPASTAATSVTQPAATADSNPAAGTPPKVPQQWLFVATGRAVPAAFDRATGQFQYFHLQRYGQKGGATAMASQSLFFNSGMVFDVATGEALNTVGNGPLVVTPDGLVRAADGQITAYRWVDQEAKDRRGKAVTQRGLAPLWQVGDIPQAAELVVAGTRAIAGSRNRVSMVDGTTQQLVWSAEVDGTASGLAVSSGRLLVSTDQGVISCFGPATLTSAAAPVAAGPAEPSAEVSETIIQAAQDILRTSGVVDGYCLDLGCGDGSLAAELARHSNLQVIAVDDDADLLAAARRRLRADRLLGARVTVLHAADLRDTGLPSYFANLIVSARSLTAAGAVPLAEAERLLRPWGGVQVTGPAQQLQTHVRGPLEGAGNWTHQYQNAGNALCSTDEYVQGPLGMLWFRDVAMDMPNRHGRGPGPLFYEGLLYSEGMDELACVDAYNGRLLWKYPLPGILKAFNGDELMGTSGTHSNYCIADSGVYVRRDDHCLRIDRRTGELLNRFYAPPQADGKPSTWGFIACENGLLLGSAANPEHVVTFRYLDRGGDMSAQLTESRALFAMDAVTGRLLWKYDAQHSIRHNAIALGQDTVYLIDRPLAQFDRTRTKTAEPQAPGSLLALDARAGSPRWRNDERIDGTLLALSSDHATLLMSYQPTRFALASEVGGRLAAFDTQDGARRWEKQAAYASRPLINDRTVYAQGGAWDLLTGDTRPFNFSRSYGCGVLAGSRHMMVFRSATLGYFDLQRNERTENFGGIRPGCWINAIPAGGLVLVPDASAGCSCSYLNQTWFALEPDGLRPPRMQPQGGAFREAVDVQLTADAPDHEIRYTLDGSVPERTSPQLTDTLQVHQEVVLRARAFAANGRASRTTTARFIIDPRLVPIEADHWTVWDNPDKPAGGPSLWSTRDGIIAQTSNIYQGDAAGTDMHTERYGTLRIYEGGREFTDGTLQLEFKAGDDDTIGVAFRVQDSAHHYLWSSDLQRGFSTLALKHGSTWKILASTKQAYQRETWHQLRIHMQGARLTVLLDGQEQLTADDATLPQGTLALHTWGSDRTQFRAIRLEAAPAP